MQILTIKSSLIPPHPHPNKKNLRENEASNHKYKICLTYIQQRDSIYIKKQSDIFRMKCQKYKGANNIKHSKSSTN